MESTNVSIVRIIQGGNILFRVTPIIVPNKTKGITTTAILKSMAEASLKGFFLFNPMRKAVRAPVKIISLEIGTASFGLKLR